MVAASVPFAPARAHGHRRLSDVFRSASAFQVGQAGARWQHCNLLACAPRLTVAHRKVLRSASLSSFTVSFPVHFRFLSPPGALRRLAIPFVPHSTARPEWRSLADRQAPGSGFRPPATAPPGFKSECGWPRDFVRPAAPPFLSAFPISAFYFPPPSGRGEVGPSVCAPHHNSFLLSQFLLSAFTVGSRWSCRRDAFARSIIPPATTVNSLDRPDKLIYKEFHERRYATIPTHIS